MVEKQSYIPPDVRDINSEKTFRERWYALFSREETQTIIKNISSGILPTTSVDVLFRTSNFYINDRLPKKFRSYSVGFDEASYYINFRMLPAVKEAIESKNRGFEPSDLDSLSSIPLFKILKFSEKFKNDTNESLCKVGLENRHEIEVDESKLSEEDFITINEECLQDFLDIINEEATNMGDQINKRKIKLSLELFAKHFTNIVQLHNQLIS